MLFLMIVMNVRGEILFILQIQISIVTMIVLGAHTLIHVMIVLEEQQVKRNVNKIVLELGEVMQ